MYQWTEAESSSTPDGMEPNGQMKPLIDSPPPWPRSAGVDAVYFFMDPGWETEPPGNRWHYGRRFARTLPVYLLQGTLTASQRTTVSEPEPRIPGATILRVRRIKRASMPEAEATSAVAAAQILQHMQEHQIKNPLFWIITPWWGHVVQMLPARFRVFHVCDDYWRMAGLTDGVASGEVPPLFGQLLPRTGRAAQVMLAVSEGVAAAAQRGAPGVPCRVVTNGCDFSVFSGGTPDGAVLQAAQGRRIAVYGGKLGPNLNWNLLNRLAETYPDTFLALFGREETLLNPEAEAERLRLLVRDNVCHLGEVPQLRLRDIYAAAHVGIIPYLELPHIVESSFAMKTLEYAAAGLPVITSHLKPVRGLATAIRVCVGDDEFTQAYTQLDRRTVTPEEQEGLVAAAQSRDYDTLFSQACQTLDEALRTGPTRLTAADAEWDAWWQLHPAATATEFLIEAHRRQPDPALATELTRRQAMALPGTPTITAKRLRWWAPWTWLRAKTT
jgi:glycosyltransferase involved in cell wall biosynthesis